nr:protein FAM219B [Vulpes vulpes]
MCLRHTVLRLCRPRGPGRRRCGARGPRRSGRAPSPFPQGLSSEAGQEPSRRLFPVSYDPRGVKRRLGLGLAASPPSAAGRRGGECSRFWKQQAFPPEPQRSACPQRLGPVLWPSLPVTGGASSLPALFPSPPRSVKFNKGYTALSQSPDENLVSLDSDSDGELESRYSSGYSSAEQVNQDVSRQLLQDGYHLDEIPDDEDLDLIPPKPMASSTCSCCWCCPGDSSSCTLQ